MFVDEPVRVSVLMTIFNAAPYLRAALDSVLSQTFQEWELIAIENGSTDDSPNILASYSDDRIRVTWLGENIGRTPALRRAFGLASGEYYAVLDADDVSHPERLAAQVELLDDNLDVVVVGTWARHIDENGLLLDDNGWTPAPDARVLHESLGWLNPIVHSSAMYRAHLADRLGGYPAHLTYAQDAGLWQRLAQHGSLAIIDEYLCDYRVLQHGMTSSEEYRVDVALDRLDLLRYARRHLGLSRGALRRNRDEILITEIKLGLAISRSRSRIVGLWKIVVAVLRNPTGLLRNRVTTSWLRSARPLSRKSLWPTG